MKYRNFLLVFLTLLPLINSVFDWLSLAVTRALLRHVLAMTIAAALQVMDRLSQSGGEPKFFDLVGTLHRVRTEPADPAIWWVYFTLFSTLLPTLAHAAIVTGSFVTWRLPDALKQRWLSLIDNHDPKEKFSRIVWLGRASNYSRSHWRRPQRGRPLRFSLCCASGCCRNSAGRCSGYAKAWRACSAQP